MEFLNKLKCFAMELKAKIAGDNMMTLDEVVKVLATELNYPKDTAMRFVSRFDKNKDGKLSAEEFDSFRSKITDLILKTVLVPKFKEYDRDGNGFITLEEASTILQSQPFNFPAVKVAMLLKNFDKDNKGKLDIEEFAGFYAEAKATHDDLVQHFDKLDKDGNGVLSPDEVVCVRREMMGYDEETARYFMSMFDQNCDGNLDKAEFIHMWTSLFG